MSGPRNPEPSRPRIRKAYSDRPETSGVDGPAGSQAGSGSAPAGVAQGGRSRPVNAHDGTPIALSDPGGPGFWYGPDAVLYFRQPDGTQYFLRGDQQFLPLTALTDADRREAAAAGVPGRPSAPAGAPARPSAPPGAPGPHTPGAPGHGASGPGVAQPSAADDRSTYYEYIAHHSGETPAVQGPPAAQGTPGGSAPGVTTAYEAPAGAYAGATAGPYAAQQPAGYQGYPDPTQQPGGAGKPRRRGLVWGFVGFGLVLVIAAVLGLVFLWPERGTQPTELDPPTAQESANPTPSGSPGQPSETPTTAPAAPSERLDAYAEEGTEVAERDLTETWVVQLSAKKPGLEAEGTTWSEKDIVEEFEENQRRYPEAVLLWSGDWQSFRMGDFWITVLAEPYSDPDDALARCSELGIDRDNCYAKKLSKTMGPEDTTRLND